MSNTAQPPPPGTGLVPTITPPALPGAPGVPQHWTPQQRADQAAEWQRLRDVTRTMATVIELLQMHPEIVAWVHAYSAPFNPTPGALPP